MIEIIGKVIDFVGVWAFRASCALITLMVLAIFFGNFIDRVERRARLSIGQYRNLP